MNRHAPLVALVSLSLLVSSACRREQAAAAESPVRKAPAPLDFGGDFALTNQDGRPFRLADARGKTVLLFFGYTSCPDMCPMTMSRIAGALRLVGEKRSEVVTLFVSVDPKRDTPQVLKEYVSSFSTPLIGLTGSQDEVTKMAAQYRASFEYMQTESPNYLVNHTTAIFLIDPQGRLREYFAYNEKPERLAAGLRAIMSGA